MKSLDVTTVKCNNSASAMVRIKYFFHPLCNRCCAKRDNFFPPPSPFLFRDGADSVSSLPPSLGVRSFTAPPNIFSSNGMEGECSGVESSILILFVDVTVD